MWHVLKCELFFILVFRRGGFLVKSFQLLISVTSTVFGKLLQNLIHLTFAVQGNRVFCTPVSQSR